MHMTVFVVCKLTSVYFDENGCVLFLPYCMCLCACLPVCVFVHDPVIKCFLVPDRLGRPLLCAERKEVPQQWHVWKGV